VNDTPNQTGPDQRKQDQNGFGGDSRRMLRQLRDVMAQSGTDQERLDQIVRIIAADMGTEVCSIYVRRTDNILELCATEGLNPEAVHRTRLRVGEGLVGDIAARARPHALSDAQSHPKFAYRPETGEEIYQSLMGVPVLRSERVLGVIVVQNRTRRRYADEEIETLETFAMALADLLSSNRIFGGEDGAGGRTAPARLTGLAIVPGISFGRVHLHRQPLVIRRAVAEDPDVELSRLNAALAALHQRLDDLMEGAPLSKIGEHAEVLQAYRMFARDRGWLSRMRDAIANGLTAEAAVQHGLNDTRARMDRIADPYLRERLHDFEALADELMGDLADGAAPGDGAPVGRAAPPENAVLVARNMGPADILAYDRNNLRGVVLEEGSATAHVAIVARALDIPLIGKVEGILNEVEPGDSIIVDGDHAQVFLRPADEVQEQFARSVEARVAARARFAGLKDVPCVTRDGVPVSLYLNAGLLVDMPQVAATGADGVGLFRTEIPFMARRDFPDVDAQTELYQAIIAGADGHPVTFRALDVGGDKHLQSFATEAELNPAMGWRSMRILLDRPSILRQQIRALVRASAERELRLMFPMVTDVAEFDRAKGIVEREIARAAERDGKPPSKLLLGAMIEVPALLWQLEHLLSRVDFLSIGTNDLFQFIFAVDRDSDRVTRRYDMLSPAFLRVLKRIARSCADAGVPVTICGEMAGRPLEALALVGLGYRQLSMTAASIGPVKEAIMSTNCHGITDFVDNILINYQNHARGALTGYARDHQIPT
jgi:phosphotransferase system enzyme I (PtsP)